MGGGLHGPDFIAIDASGNVWAANPNGNCVTELISAAAPTRTPLVAAITPDKELLHRPADGFFRAGRIGVSPQRRDRHNRPQSASGACKQRNGDYRTSGLRKDVIAGMQNPALFGGGE
jgi:hypothetical protein